MGIGTKLKAKSGWRNDGKGTDDFGFSDLPGAVRTCDDGRFDDVGGYGSWWSSSSNGRYVWGRDLFFNDPGFYRLNTNLRFGLSVRCVKDAD